MIKKLLKQVSNQRQQERRVELQRNLIRHEAKIGGQLFGPVAPGTRREFFCLDKHTWIWHEEWVDSGQRKSRTTRYDIRPTTILKTQDGQHYQNVTTEEAGRLYQAVRLYNQRVREEIYSFV
jgi:hypothetical protein